MSDFIRCPNCNAKNFEKDKQCSKCGAELHAPANQAATSPAPAPGDSTIVPQPPAQPTSTAIAPQVTPPQPVDPRIISVEQRQMILGQEIQSYIKQGYRVVSQTSTTAQLVKPKRLDCGVAVLVLLLSIITLGIVFILYLIWYVAQKDQQVYIDVNEYGKVNAVKSTA